LTVLSNEMEHRAPLQQRSLFVKPRLHDITGSQTSCHLGLTTGMTTGCIV